MIHTLNELNPYTKTGNFENLSNAFQLSFTNMSDSSSMNKNCKVTSSTLNHGICTCLLANESIDSDPLNISHSFKSASPIIKKVDKSNKSLRILEKKCHLQQIMYLMN